MNILMTKEGKRNIYIFLLDVEGNMVTKDEEKVWGIRYSALVTKDEVLNAFFTSVFNRKASYPQDNQSSPLVDQDRHPLQPRMK